MWRDHRSLYAQADMAHFHPIIVIGCLNDRNTNNTNKFLKGKTLLFISIYYISNVGQVNVYLLPPSFVQSIHVLILFSVCKDTFHYSKVRFRNSLTKEGCGTSLCMKEANSTSCVILLLPLWQHQKTGSKWAFKAMDLHFYSVSLQTSGSGYSDDLI